MIEYITLQSPLSVINGVPASMAGEWPGIKPNKFPKTKRIIHTKNSNIFSLENPFPMRSQKKIIFQIPKKEEENFIRPKSKRICSAISLNKLKEKDFYEIIPSSVKSNRLVINRVYDFERRAKYYKNMQDNFDKKMKENEIMNKTKKSESLNNISNNPKKGFNKKFYENVSKNKILQVTLNHDIYYRYKSKIEKMKKYNNDLGNKNKKRRIHSCKDFYSQKKIKEMEKQQEKLAYDINYVASLGIK